MSKVSKLEINTSLMGTGETTRTLKVLGKVGAKFFIVLTQDSTIKFYDWTTDTFTSGHSPKNNLSVTMSSSFFQRNIVFPSGGGTGGTYVLKLITLDEPTTGGFNVISRDIEKQTTETTMTFKPASDVSSTKYATLPSSTSVGTGSDVVSTSFSFKVETATSDVGGFGLRPEASSFENITILNEHLQTSAHRNCYYQITKTITSNPAGDGVSSAKVILSNVSELAVGTQVYYHKTTTKPASTTTITAIDSDTNVVDFNNAVAFEDGETITFRAYGQKYIKYALGIDFTLDAINIVDTGSVVKTVRADGGVSEATDGSSTTICLNNTLGITGGNVIGYRGEGVDNSSSNAVTSVTADPSGGDGDGLIVVQNAQELTAGTQLTFANTFTYVTFSGETRMENFPSSNKEINLDLDLLLTTGAAS
jgi:hypothetical protein